MVRPRSQHAHEKVLRGALDLFGERDVSLNLQCGEEA
jgi:hypothetical protein